MDNLPERGVYLVPIESLGNVGNTCYWRDPDLHNWFNRHRLIINSTPSIPEDVSIPIAFDSGGGAACNIVAGSPLLRDLNGEPIGVPMQISKNWHDSIVGAWYQSAHLCTFKMGRGICSSSCSALLDRLGDKSTVG